MCLSLLDMLFRKWKGHQCWHDFTCSQKKKRTHVVQWRLWSHGVYGSIVSSGADLIGICGVCRPTQILGLLFKSFLNSNRGLMGHNIVPVDWIPLLGDVVCNSVCGNVWMAAAKVSKQNPVLYWDDCCHSRVSSFNVMLPVGGYCSLSHGDDVWLDPLFMMILK